MSVRNDGGPAFPLAGDGPVSAVSGMSLRDWFAGQALANTYTHDYDTPEVVAVFSYLIADAMLEARK